MPECPRGTASPIPIGTIIAETVRVGVIKVSFKPIHVLVEDIEFGLSFIFVMGFVFTTETLVPKSDVILWVPVHRSLLFNELPDLGPTPGSPAVIFRRPH